MPALRNGAIHSGLGLPTTASLIKKYHTDLSSIQPDVENPNWSLIFQEILCIVNLTIKSSHHKDFLCAIAVWI